MKTYGNFLLLAQGMAITNVGMFLFNVVGTIWLADVVGSGSLVGLLLFVMGMAGVVTSLLGGVLADRFRRRDIIVLADCLIGVAILSLSLVFFLSSNVVLQVISLFVIQGVVGLIAGLASPAFIALLPSLLPADRLSMGNSVLNVIVPVCGLIGRAIGGLWFAVLGVPLLLLITGFASLLSALSESFIKEPIDDTSLMKKSTPETKSRLEGALKEIGEGIVYIISKKEIRSIILMRIGCQWCVGSIAVTVLFLLDSHYEKGTHWYAYLMGVLTIGIMIGSVCAGFTFNRLDIRTLIFRISLLILPVVCISLAFASNITGAILLIFLIGFCFVIPSIFSITQLQLCVPNELRGRVISIVMMLSLFAPIAGFLVGILIDILEKNVVIVQVVTGVIVGLMIYPSLLNNTWLDFFRGPAIKSGA